MKNTTKINNNHEENKGLSPEERDVDLSWFIKWRDDLPYNKKRYTIIILFTLLIFLVVFLGFAYGGMKVCSQVNGVLDNKFKCHPDYYQTQLHQGVDSVGQPFKIPNITVENGS